MRAATARHMDDVSGNARWQLPMEIARPTTSAASRVTRVPSRAVYSAGAVTTATLGVAALPGMPMRCEAATRIFSSRAGERLVRVYRLGHLGAGDADIARAHENHRNRRIHQRGLDAVDDVAWFAGRQEAPGPRAAGLDEVEGDARPRAGHAGQLEVTVHGWLAARHGHARHDQLLRVRVVDTHEGLAVHGLDQALLDGEGTNGRGAVPAIARVVHLRLAHLNLGEGVVDVGGGVARGPDDARLGEGGDASAQTVELASVGIGAAQRRQENVVALHPGGREIALVEDEAAAGAAAHVDGSDAGLGHGFLTVPSLVILRGWCP